MDLNRKWYQKFTLMVNDFENTFIDLKDREEIKFDILQVNWFLQYSRSLMQVLPLLWFR